MELEKIKISKRTEEVWEEYPMNFSMLLAHVRQQMAMGGSSMIKIKVGVWDCLFTVMEQED